MNCWEYTRCGREKGGIKVAELGACPAYPDGGQTCARVSGTLCNGTKQGNLASKLTECMRCDFYNSEEYRRN
jgi:hypothetical protein